MRLVFAGTSEFAVPVLEALVGAGHDVARVLTRPNRPAGRGRRATPAPVRRAAVALGLPVETPVQLDAAVTARLRVLEPEALIVVAYGLLIPAAIRAVPQHGALNVHPSLLPRWRGAAPVEHALLAGDSETGVAVMALDEGLDTGPLYGMQSVQIDPRESAGELARRLADLGARLLIRVLADLAAGRARPQPQSGPATYAGRLAPEDAKLDFGASVAELARRVRAFNPRPMAWAECAGERVRILRAVAVPGPSRAAAGTVIAAGPQGIDVATGEGILRILELQRPGKRPQPAAALVQGRTWLGLEFH